MLPTLLRSNLLGTDAVAWIGEQGGVQSALGRAGFGRRRQLRSRQIGFQEFVGDEQAAARVAIGQMMAAGEPKILHPRSPRASVARSTVSAGSSLASASRKEKARHRFDPPRGRKLRKLSRIVPLSFVR